jgi:hypothetical protein
MPNPFLPRAQVHEWSEAIGSHPDLHQSSITRLVKDQRRLSRFVEENAKGMASGLTGGVAVYLIGVVMRMFDLAGGRMRDVTWEQVRAAEARVQGLVPQVLPLGAGLVERLRAAPRAQPHVLDEAIYALMERSSKPEETPLDETEAFKVYLLLWVATEALDANWTPPKGFTGEATYTFTPVPAKD